jgi:hypothetical protein
VNRQGFTIELPNETTINCTVLREAIHLGQNIEKFKIVLLSNDLQVDEINVTTPGTKRILIFPA